MKHQSNDLLETVLVLLDNSVIWRYGLRYFTLFAVALIMLVSASSSYAQNNGTRLTAALGVASIQCIDSDSALVDISTTVTTSGSVDSAEIRTSIDGNAADTMGWIDPQSFAHNGRFKTAVSSFSQVFQNGSHTVSSCYVQSGADGRTTKQICAGSSAFTVDCAPEDPCSSVEVFGNIIGSGNLCRGQAIPVSVKGSFGDGGNLIITRDGFSTSIPFERAGNSCVYHAQYLPNSDGNTGAGVYLFTLVGDNGAAYSFSADLKCR